VTIKLKKEKITISIAVGYLPAGRQEDKGKCFFVLKNPAQKENII
jgi:hypothetical protein